LEISISLLKIIFHEFYLPGEARIKPPKLKPGGTIAVIAPSSYPDYPHFALYEGLEYVKQLGYKIILGKTLTTASSKWYLSGEDKFRSGDISWAFANDEVDAIICARGGVGSMRIVSSLDYDMIRNHPKLFVGYSDVTSIQNAMLNLSGLVSLQGPMVGVGLRKDPDNDPERHKKYWSTMLQIMSGEQLQLGLWQGGPAPLTIKEGEATGRLVGGNLILFTLLNGSRYMPSPEGKVLFLEDIDEEAWRIDNFFGGLESSGYLSQVSSVVLGEFPRKPDTVDPVQLEEVFRSYLMSKPYPSFVNFPCCHGYGRETIPLGIDVKVDANERRLTMLEPAVE
jgi:muramoyltetrapeptide carboxypeptidase